MFDGLSLTVLVGAFAVAVVVTWVAGLSLAKTTAVLSDQLKLGQAIGGLLLLAVATNLPEIAITFSAALNGEMELAVGNLLGGVAIQTVVLVALDAAGGKGQPLTSRANSLELVLEGILVVAVLAVAVMGAQLPAGDGAVSVIVAPAIIFAIWAAGVWIMMQARRDLPWQTVAKVAASTTPAPQATRSSPPAKRGPWRAVAAFSVAGLATLVAGVVLERTGTVIADRIGLSGVIFGATVLAAATSLPELSTGIASIRMKDYQLAVSDIFGGNAFLPALLLPAALISGQAGLPEAGATTVLLAALGILLTCIYVVGLILRPPHKWLGLGIDSWLVLLLYAVGVGALALIPVTG